MPKYMRRDMLKITAGAVAVSPLTGGEPRATARRESARSASPEPLTAAREPPPTECCCTWTPNRLTTSLSIHGWHRHSCLCQGKMHSMHSTQARVPVPLKPEQSTDRTR